MNTMSLSPAQTPIQTPTQSPVADAGGWLPQSQSLWQRRGAAAVVMVLHAAVLLALWHAGQHVVARLQPAVAPLQVRVLPPTSAASPQPVQVPTPQVALAPVTAVIQLPAPEFMPVQAARESAAAPVAAQAPAPVTLGAPDAAPARATVTPPPGPKPVAAGSLRYRIEPAVEVPRLSRRAGEQGQVLLRVVFDTDGRPRDIQLLRSSGFARLDAQAREAMQAARITPYLEDGRPIEVVAQATLAYELD